jgi:thiamine monophosphate kinase
VPLRDRARAVERSIGDGEDYELLIAVDGGVELPAVLDDGTVMTRIGRVTEGEGAVLRWQGGRVLDATDAGWDHGS